MTTPFDPRNPGAQPATQPDATRAVPYTPPSGPDALQTLLGNIKGHLGEIRDLPNADWSVQGITRSLQSVSPDDLQNMVMGTIAPEDLPAAEKHAFLTAEDPALHPSDNVVRNNVLAQTIAKRGYTAYPIAEQALDNGVVSTRRGYYVPDLDVPDAKILAKTFGQSSVTTHAGEHALDDVKGVTPFFPQMTREQLGDLGSTVARKPLPLKSGDDVLSATRSQVSQRRDLSNIQRVLARMRSPNP